MPTPELGRLADARISERKTDARLGATEAVHDDLFGYLRKSALDEDGEIMPGSRRPQSCRGESISYDVRSGHKTNESSSLTDVPSKWSAPIWVSPKSRKSADSRDSHATRVMHTDAFLFGGYGKRLNKKHRSAASQTSVERKAGDENVIPVRSAKKMTSVFLTLYGVFQFREGFNFSITILG